MLASGCRSRNETTEPFYILLWACHLVAIRSAIWRARDVIPTNTNLKKETNVRFLIIKQ